MLKKIIKKITPEFVLKFYYKTWAVLAALFYGFPSRRLVVIGVTGTKGKSTTSNMIHKVLQDNGFKTGMTTTANFRIGDKEWINDTKMTMLGRMRLQKLLRQMVSAGCTHAVVETSSEGIKQFRHLGIDYNMAVFTNLTPEHIESHGSFQNYKLAKAELFQKLKGKGVIIVNADDEYGEFYNSFPAEVHKTYGINNQADIRASEIQNRGNGSYFIVNDIPFHLPLRGEFNIYNALAGITVARELNIAWDKITKSIADFDYVPGRMEEIKSSKGFSVFIDYAHTPESLEAVYKTLKPEEGRLIAVLGSCGGGRDKAKRPVLGSLAGQYANIVFITNEDPYDEDPEKIVDDVWTGLENYDVEKYKVIDREQAIQQAIAKAGKGDVVVITGKGSEQCIVTAQGKQPWDDREVVRKFV